MGVECQVLLNSKNKFHKGDIIYIHEGPAYHLGDSRPHFLNAIITDAVLADIEPYMEPLEHEFEVLVQGSNCRISRRFVSTLLTDDQKQKIKTGIMNLLGAEDDSIFTITSDYIQFPRQGNSAEIIENKVNDDIKYPDIPRKYKIKSSVIDNAISNGNYEVEITLAQLQSNIIDKSTRL